VEVLNYILLAYSFLGLLIVGGLIFNSKNKANVFLAIYISLFSIDQLYFLYESTSIIWAYPKFYWSTFPFTLLFGPMLFFHIKYLNKDFKFFQIKTIIHITPFILLLIFTIYILTIPSLERIKFVGGIYYVVISPLNYFKVFHLCIYAVLMIVFIKKHKKTISLKRKNYFVVLVSIYFFTALLQTCLTAAILLSKYFILYYIVASSIVLFIGYILHYHSDILEKVSIKYSRSNLNGDDKKRIYDKIEAYFIDINNTIDQELSLEKLALNIDEKKHHISQTLSEDHKTSFNHLINKKRIDYSKHLLLSEDNNFKILAVALESGFTNKTTFNRAFIKYNSCTPSEYRTKNK